MKLNLSCSWLYSALILATAFAARAELSVEIVSVRKIWSGGNHNAFTDLTRFNGQWFCVFREAKAHVSPDGAIRVLRSADGETWNSAALITLDGYDLRDPKVDLTPDGKRLMIVGGSTVREGNKPATESQSFTTFSGDGVRWSKPQWAGPTNFWLWRVTWHEQKAYGIAYDVAPASRNAKKYGTTLLASEDGVKFQPLVGELFNESGPTEATLRFAQDGTGYCLQRRDGKPTNTALLGSAKPPYTKWEWKDLGKYFGGPNFIQLPSGQWIAVGRLLNYGTPPATKTVVCELDVAKQELRPIVTLPSGGDSSYPGLVWHDEQLWVSYYSSHEGRTSIYLARLKVGR